jgi:hypothetical protein
MVYPRLSTRSDFTVAIAAVNGLITAGLKGDFGAFAAFGAGCGEHLARGSVTATAAGALAFRLSFLTAFRTALGLVGVAFRLEKLLVFSAKGESGSAIGTLDGLVLKTHWMTSSLNS